VKRVPLRILGGRCSDGEPPISVGVPLPIGFAKPGVRWVIASPDEGPKPVQTRTLAVWPDGSIKWLLAVFSFSRPSSDALGLELLAVEESEPQGRVRRAITARSENNGVTIDAGDLGLQIVRGSDNIFCEGGNGAPGWLGPLGCRLLLTDSRGRRETSELETVRVTEAGPVRAQVAIAGKLGQRSGLRFSGDISCFAGSNLVRLRVTLENPRRARHSGGYWDLGDPGSILLQDLSVELATLADTCRRIDWLEESAAQARTTAGELLELYQGSSGGGNWQSRNHINREGQIPIAVRGYRVRTQEGAWEGLRASPVASLSWDQKHVSIALEEFWQQFPSAIEVAGDRVTARLLPQQFGDLHEIQGGEHNTRVLWIELGSGDGAASCQRLSFTHDPPIAVPDPDWLAASGVLPFFPPPKTPRRREMQSLSEEALTGESSFFTKREVIDEFGWRHFGDMWADHEGAFAEGPSPVISHYNNQYDLLLGLLVQFLVTEDLRWWQLADPLARHLMDIDIYHTKRDRAAYNEGMFWHTAHYHDAGTGTHRSMSKTMVGKRVPALGGGPGNEHNYASGLLLYHFLTGCTRARVTVLGLADWVIAIDDGRQHRFCVLSDTPTGDASRTGPPDFHGPGRGAGNSINTLLDGWLVSRDSRHLAMLEKLIRRTIHPLDDLERRDLGNAELRWSYTVYLQALVRTLELTAPEPDLDELKVYIREALLHYGNWMATNEKFYLDAPDSLEYPTETWAAQELRKGTTLLMIADYAKPEDRAHLVDRGTQILNRGWLSLMSFESRSCTRPLALVLQQGYLEEFLLAEERPLVSVEGGDPTANWLIDSGVPTDFVDQRMWIRSLATAPWRLPQVLPHALGLSNWRSVVKQTWLFERLRRLVEYWG
jgi:hypothetical protein